MIYNSKFIIRQPGSQSHKRGMFYLLTSLSEEKVSDYFISRVQSLIEGYCLKTLLPRHDVLSLQCRRTLIGLLTQANNYCVFLFIENK